MVNPQNDEQAALNALGLLEEAQQRDLLAAAQVDPALELLLLDYERTAAALVFSLPWEAPPPEVKDDLLKQIPWQRGMPSWRHFTAWAPYLACFVLLILNSFLFLQWLHFRAEIKVLSTKPEPAPIAAQPPALAAEPVSPTLDGLQLFVLSAKDNAVDPGQILLAWKVNTGELVITAKRLPEKRESYQCWAMPAHGPAVNLGSVSNGSRALQMPVSLVPKSFFVTLEKNNKAAEPTSPKLYRTVLP